MNQPDRYTQFVLPEGESKVAYKADTKLEHAGTFTFRSEDHTIGNLLRMQLHRDPTVVFAGYRIPHPLEAKMVVKVQTNGAKAPEASLQDALIDIGSEFTSITQQFEAAIQKQQEANGYQPFKESDTHQQGQLMDDMGQHSMGQGDMGYAPANQY